MSHPNICEDNYKFTFCDIWGSMLEDICIHTLYDVKLCSLFILWELSYNQGKFRLWESPVQMKVSPSLIRNRKQGGLMTS